VTSILGGIFLVALIFATQNDHSFDGFFPDLFPTDIIGIVQMIWALSAVWSLIAVVLQFIGGIYAIKRQKWLLVLISSVVTFMVIFPIGIPAIVFTIMSKEEFE
jgi:hypothetical protein